MSRVTREEALELWIGEKQRPSRVGEVSQSVGWDVGVAQHPMVAEQIVLVAQRAEDEVVVFAVMGLAEILKPFTNDEVRAQVKHRIQTLGEPEGVEVPDVVALSIGEIVVKRLRP